MLSLAQLHALVLQSNSKAEKRTAEQAVAGGLATDQVLVFEDPHNPGDYWAVIENSAARTGFDLKGADIVNL